MSLNAAAVTLIAICILSAAILVAVTSSDHPAVVTAASSAQAPAIEKLAAPSPKTRSIEPRPTDAEPAVAAAPTTSAAVAAAKPVTITGCLERAGGSFRLVDTNGTRAPKTRSWKSGFLKKSNAAVAVVDASKRLNLSRHVNERVGVTGVLSGHSMQARSISRVASKCS